METPERGAYWPGITDASENNLPATPGDDSPPGGRELTGKEDSPFLSPEVRSLFPAVKDKIYFDIALHGIIPQPVADVAHAHVEGRLLATDDKAEFRASTERCRETLAELLGAGAE